MKANKIDHLGIVVKDLDAAIKTWEGALGLRLAEVEEIASEKVKVAMFPVGESRIELLCPTDDQSGVAKFLSKRGEGIHHVCVEVDNVESALAELKSKDFKLINETPIIGAGGRKAAFIHPKSTNGVLLEIYESAG